jgi:predicted NACHT family NTPase
LFKVLDAKLIGKIDEIFVPPRISRVPLRKTDETETLSLPAFLSRLYRGVLLGNPGGGKSTASAKICFDLATKYSDRLFAGREVTPAIVILREYGSQKKATNCSIVEFLEQQAKSRYQLRPPENAFEYLLLNGRMLVVFDGLDELLDTSYRQEITSNVEAFCKLYPSVPVLVTSREVGYEEAPLSEKTFDLFQLAPFDDKQVREYADKWFARDEDYSPEQKTQKARAFFEDSALVPDLRSNPLMLGLMCNLYRAEGYIPRNRPEVYGKCSVMLFERWDKSRDILVLLGQERTF